MKPVQHTRTMVKMTSQPKAIQRSPIELNAPALETAHGENSPK